MVCRIITRDMGVKYYSHLELSIDCIIYNILLKRFAYIHYFFVLSLSAQVSQYGFYIICNIHCIMTLEQ